VPDALTPFDVAIAIHVVDGQQTQIRFATARALPTVSQHRGRFGKLISVSLVLQTTFARSRTWRTGRATVIAALSSLSSPISSDAIVRNEPARCAFPQSSGRWPFAALITQTSGPEFSLPLLTALALDGAAFLALFGR
jgi:hypothetical protein